MLKIIGAAVISSFTALLLKKTNPEFALITVLCAGVFILTAISISIISIMNELRTINGYSEMYGFLEPVFKASGISVVTYVAANLCRDCEQTAMASKVELAGNIAVLILSLPLIKNILDVIYELI